MEDRIEEVFASEITRADFLKRAAATGIGLSLLSGVGAAGAHDVGVFVPAHVILSRGDGEGSAPLRDDERPTS